MTYNEKKEYLKSYKTMTAVLKRIQSRKLFFALSSAEEREQEHLERHLEKIREEISLVSSPVSKEILNQRYVEGAALCAVGESLGYSARHIQRLHKTAVEEFEAL